MIKRLFVVPTRTVPAIAGAGDENYQDAALVDAPVRAEESCVGKEDEDLRVSSGPDGKELCGQFKCDKTPGEGGD